jgi:hypothetical protein
MMAIERGKLQNLIFDNQAMASHRAMAAVLGVILKSTLKQAWPAGGWVRTPSLIAVDQAPAARAKASRPGVRPQEVGRSPAAG